MILSLTIANFLSINEKLTLSLEATSIKEHRDRNCFNVPNKEKQLLKGIGLFGPNSSGKSNILKALGFMRSFVLNSFLEIHATESINVERFKLSTATNDKPSFFEIEFFSYDKKYRYGFEVDKSKVLSEWLFYTSRKQEKKCFTRSAELFEIESGFAEGWNFQKYVRDNSLAVSVMAQFNGPTSKEIYQWFKEVVIINDSNYLDFINSTAELTNKDKTKSYLRKFLNAGDLGFDEIEITENPVDPNQFTFLSDEIRTLVASKLPKYIDIKTRHKKLDNQGNLADIVLMDFKKEESLGTQKFFALAGPIIKSLINGTPIIIDELDARLHPQLSKMIIQLFNSIDNQNHSQLIFVTHNTNILTEDILRRDQMILVFKGGGHNTEFKSVYDLKVRYDASFEKDYLSGKYGAIPGKGHSQLNLFN